MILATALVAAVTAERDKATIACLLKSKLLEVIAPKNTNAKVAIKVTPALIKCLFNV